MKIIGLSGKIGTGKTTLGDLIETQLEGEVLRKAYGDFLKEEVSSVYGFPLAWCYTQNGKLKEVEITHPEGAFVETKTVRELLQSYGQEKRKENPDYWTDQMRAFIAFQQGFYTHYPHDVYLIIDDVRYPNEAQLVTELGGHLIRLEPYPGWQEHPEYGKHESETALDDFIFPSTYFPGLNMLEQVAESVVKGLG